MLRERIALLRGAGLPEGARAYLRKLLAESMSQSVRSARLVVLDTETTGFDVKKDNILQIGAVGIQAGRIVIGDSFESNVRSEHAGAAEHIVVHGLRPVDVLAAPEMRDLILPLLGFLGGSVIVGHHVQFDQRILSMNMRRYFPFGLYNRLVDTAQLAVRIEKPGTSPHEINWKEFGLDALCDRYNIRRTGRHTAAGDAYITAELFLKLLSRLEERGIRTLADLVV